MTRLRDKRILVTGTARGVGEEIARQAVAEGARVALVDVLDERGRAVADSLGDRAVYLHLDISSDDEWSAALPQIVEHLGGLDGLVNNAAIYKGTSPIEDESLSVFELTLRINVVGTWLGIKNVIAPIRERGGGAIVNISSIAGMKGLPGFSSYGSSKWAVRGLTKIAAKELGQYGIRVNSVHPGGIEGTGMFTPATTPDDRQQRYAGVPLGRPGRTDEVSSLVLFLLSEASSYVTGVEHIIDGGSIV